MLPVFLCNTGRKTIDRGCLHDEVVVVILKRGAAGIVTPIKRTVIVDDGPIAVTTPTTNNTTAIAEHGVDKQVRSILGRGLGNALRQCSLPAADIKNAAVKRKECISVALIEALFV